MIPLFLFAFATILSTARGQGPRIDPFAGSNCTCDTFCKNECSINATGPATMTFYRMTPFGVMSLAEKDTGDARGDTSFVLSRKTAGYTCSQDPSSFLCQGVTQFQGDNPNSTDLILSFSVEVDGEWGPYLPCNPRDPKHPEGPWVCDSNIGSPPLPQCKAANYSTFEGYCWEGLHSPNGTHLVSDEGECCSVAEAQKSSHWNYFAQNKSCVLFTVASVPIACNYNVTIGYRDTSPPPCNCTRVHRTVGRGNLTTMVGHGGQSMHPAGGEWYSHPAAGECTGTARIGDGSGCTWRVVATSRAINASCMYAHLDTNVEAEDPACFSACPQPTNVTSSCYLACYTTATQRMSGEKLAAPWGLAFASEDKSAGGCPTVVVPS